MKKLVFLFFLTTTTVVAQDLSKWSKKELELANTAKDSNYLNNNEKETIFFINLCRLNPTLFLETICKPYIDSVGIKGAHSRNYRSYVNSLYRDLTTCKKLTVVVPSMIINSITKEHCRYMIKNKQISHDSVYSRVRKINLLYFFNSEDCAYGYNTPLSLVIGYLIDDGVNDVGHRKSLIDKNNIIVGLSTIDGYNCIDFATFIVKLKTTISDRTIELTFSSVLTVSKITTSKLPHESSSMERKGSKPKLVSSNVFLIKKPKKQGFYKYVIFTEYGKSTFRIYNYDLVEIFDNSLIIIP
jgi:hypothetical protein